MENLPFTNVGTGKIKINALVELGWTETHVKEDGCLNDTPSIVFTMKDFMGMFYYTQFSLETLQGMLGKMGYTLVKKR